MIIFLNICLTILGRNWAALYVVILLANFHFAWYAECHFRNSCAAAQSTRTTDNRDPLNPETCDVDNSRCGYDKHEISCVDSNKKCAKWALKGECAANPRYMNKNCPASCRKCRGIASDGAAEGRGEGFSASPHRSVPLRPSDLPGPTVFSSFGANYTIDLPAGRFIVAPGTVKRVNRKSRSSISSDFFVLPSLVERSNIDEVLTLLRNYASENAFDEDPDTVDGMPTYEIFLDNDTIRGKQAEKGGKPLDSDSRALLTRRPLREKLNKIIQPILNDKVTPFVRAQYPDICDGEKGRKCTPCYSLIRRYRHGERQSHAMHHDGHAIVTVVTSLADYGLEYLGGLYVSTGFSQKEYLSLNKGDSVAHQSTLLHGVQVLEKDEEPESTERWSWILWYKDSETCDDYSYEWFQECAEGGDAICQQLHATKATQIPGITDHQKAELVVKWNKLAASGGAGTSAVKLGYAYLKKLPSPLPFDKNEAIKYFQMSIASSNEPDGHFGLAQIILEDLSLNENKGNVYPNQKETMLKKVFDHLENAAKAGHVFSMFNLGIAHVFGYGVNDINLKLGAEWFVQSGLPEGYFFASEFAQSVANLADATKYGTRARILGYGSQWRQMARRSTGSGGTGAVDLNMPW
eukprot:CAMPEP_0113319966 /NCGR_PEP_ID=MMETSP0010_2-20120614/13954_1 /TAXON_ID=216773 ORGANISM="Corethron hystrix, Strain 308" /NCGR_SAMPLE_ID=MMETSP0010_2 /ASSEMBLY_ACC=CAM_ASM_000155 /LENGTH=633 /DNA_ID=CAMNT_0000177635 /DNA_START=92 /DNA_END=1990 /DNA_ORIENTATION=- /assembly_acc=CAM_ASM_000155